MRCQLFAVPLVARLTAVLVLLKVARTKTGAHNPDDYIDMTGYAAIAAELADREHAG